MALVKEKTVNLSGQSFIDNTEVARFNVTIPTGENETPQFSIYVNDGELYQKNLEKVWADRDEFEKAVREEEKKLYEPERDKAEAPTSEVTETEEAPDNTSTATAATLTTKQD